MATTRQSEHEVLSLPIELIHRIAFYIQDAQDLFRLLEILRPLNLLGPFEPLLQLSLVKNWSELWPKLVVTERDTSLTAESLTHLEAFAKFYTQVQIAYANIPILNDVAWLTKYFNPMATQEWHIYTSASEEYLNELAKQRIVSLHQSRFLVDESFLNMLPKLQNLTTLVMEACEDWIDEILDFAANSQQLVVLKLSAPSNLYSKIVMTDSRLNNATQWLHRTVREFQLERWDLREAGRDARQHFCETMFNSPSLSKLTCIQSDFDAIDPSNFRFPMPSLTMFDCCLNGNISFDISSHLIGSGVTSLTHGNFYDCLRLPVRIFEILPKSSSKRLQLTHLRFYGELWNIAIDEIRHCTLDRLALKTFYISTNLLDLFSEAIRSNNSIVDLAMEDLHTNRFSAEDATKLIECATDPSRGVKLRSIKIQNIQLDEKACLEIRTFAETRGVEHITILHH